MLKPSDLAGGDAVAGLMEATLLELLLWGKGGLLVKTAGPKEAAKEMCVSDTEEAMLWAVMEVDTFCVDDVAEEATAADAMAAMLEEASWL